MSKIVSRIALPEWVDPDLMCSAVMKHFPHVAWLDSGKNALHGASYLGATHDKPSLFTAGKGESVFEWLDQELDQYKNVSYPTRKETGFNLGWVGWFGYELAQETCQVEISPSRYPDAAFIFLSWAFEWDHTNHQMFFLSMKSLEDAREEAQKLIGLTSAVMLEQDFSPVSPTKPVWRHQPSEYKNMVAQCLDAITAGDSYQLCLTNTIEIAGSFDPLETYLRLRHSNSTHHGGFLHISGISLLSLSPEVFLTITPEGTITTKPIKGTRPRGKNAQEDAALASELHDNHKERAENLMIVDLMRNDVGRVSQLGSVHVESLLTIESYDNVHQLVSTVTGKLAANLSPVDVIKSCFPAGSMTGAPKISSMNILHKLEQGPRGIYSGAYGYLGIDGTTDLAMVIRSIVIDSAGATIGTGGGITSGSQPESELEETFIKVAPLLRALGAS